ncbi:anti-sigma factor family protein [Nonomuraea basaltis]|uniref:anti-sigma factor family protein n=1 Tax=Nonomuraea basaltis TaxID=2495887 RepID=UPI00110C6D59|nr:anti-sigma factor [Nonomuraea basaltis]TMR98014.1 zf-HC2 domain-containing protein [Nonomuraea basaltis]
MKRFTCDELAELITAYLDDALDDPSRAGVEAHLACCGDCGNYLHQFRTTVRALGDQPPEKLSSGTRERLMSAFRNHRRS